MDVPARHAALGAESLRQRRERAVERDALAAVRRGGFEDPHLAMGRRAGSRVVARTARGRGRRAGGGGPAAAGGVALARTPSAFSGAAIQRSNTSICAGKTQVCGMYPKCSAPKRSCMRRKFVQRFAFSVRADARGNLFTRWCGFRSANRAVSHWPAHQKTFHSLS